MAHTNGAASGCLYSRAQNTETVPTQIRTKRRKPIRNLLLEKLELFAVSTIPQTAVVGSCAIIAAALVPGTASAQEVTNAPDKRNWEFYVGAGAIYKPEYEGSDRYEVEPGLEIQAVWRDRILISTESIGAFIVNDGPLRVSTAIGYGGGRRESSSSDLRGLGTIDNGAIVSVGMQYDLGKLVATANARKYLEGSEGTTVTLGIQSQVPFGVVRGVLAPTGSTFEDVADDSGFVLTGGVSLEWGDTKYNQSFFGVSAIQSANSGLSQYSAGAGPKSLNIDIGFALPMAETWGFTGNIVYSRLLGDAADSPIVKSKDGITATLAAVYTF